jgi:hypothetical protein
MADRSRLLDILQGAAPEGIGNAASAVGTDALPTSALEQAAGAPAPPAPGGVPPAPEAGAEDQGVQSILAGPGMTPDQRAELEAELAMAAKEELMKGQIR